MNRYEEIMSRVLKRDCDCGNVMLFCDLGFGWWCERCDKFYPIEGNEPSSFIKGVYGNI